MVYIWKIFNKSFVSPTKYKQSARGLCRCFTTSNFKMEERSFIPPDAVRDRMAVRTAGIIIIGDEVLKGEVADSNSHFISRRLHAIGVKLCRISVIPDCVEEIAKEVSKFSAKYDLVVTTGGIGPTHDDMTYQGVGAAFGEELEKHPELVNFWKELYASKSKKDPDPTEKMTTIPKSASIVYPKVSERVMSKARFPIVVVRNVFIFPGVPKFVEAAFPALEEEYFEAKANKFHGKKLYLNVDESTAVGALNMTVEKYRERVDIGSYPIFGNPVYLTKITLESSDVKTTQEAYDFLRDMLDEDWIVPHGQLIGDADIDLKHLIETQRLKDFTRTLQDSIQVIENCLERYESDEVFLSFNGGKDCTALLHLTFATIASKCKGRLPPKLQAVYFRGKHSFPEVESFIGEGAQRYNLNLVIKRAPIKEALEELLKEKPKWKVVLMGTRRSDPFSNSLSSFQETDRGWPQLMRVNPLLDWSYQDVWKFIRELSIPYCPLYDRGYTSLGNSENTRPNPALMFYDSDGTAKYRPAYRLEDGQSERRGRNHDVEGHRQ